MKMVYLILVSYIDLQAAPALETSIDGHWNS